MILQKYDFSSKSQLWEYIYPEIMAVCDTAKVRFFKQITTKLLPKRRKLELFVILQKYDFSSKSQPQCCHHVQENSCLWYCKSTIFQANHNCGRRCHCRILLFVILQKYDFSSKSQLMLRWLPTYMAVCDTAKVRFFKQITTEYVSGNLGLPLFVILQKYDFSSKSQHNLIVFIDNTSCLWYCKSTIFQANHNQIFAIMK